jgi:hypothetical protein
MRFWLVIGLVACGKPKSETAFEAADEVAQALCSRAFACQSAYPEDAEYTFQDLYYASVDTCALQLGPADPAAWERAQEEEKLTFDADLARECAQAFRDLACDELFEQVFPEVCDDVVVGTLPENAACTFDEVCASGWCRNGACTG